MYNQEIISPEIVIKQIRDIANGSRKLSTRDKITSILVGFGWNSKTRHQEFIMTLNTSQLRNLYKALNDEFGSK